MRSASIFVCFAISAIAGILCSSATAASDQKLVMGYIERVQILPENLRLKAKLDTGAHTSAIDATRLIRFERNGQPWVRFTVSDRKGKTATFERPTIRVVRVRRSDSPTTTRPVVMLVLCLGGKYRHEAVTLTNRSHLSTSVLIGRSMLQGRYLVHSARKFTSKKDCFDL